jgi:hypothetical protein
LTALGSLANATGKDEMVYIPKSAFTAKYRGHCDECGNPVEMGDLAFYTQNNELLHVRCPLERPAIICQVCYLTKPCGCDDES